MVNFAISGQIYTIVVLILFILHKIWILKDGYLAQNKIHLKTVIVDSFIWIVCILQGYTVYLSYAYPEIVHNSSPVQSDITQFIGSVLAIFFSLAIVPISNIVTNTSHAFIERVIKNQVFIKGILLFSIIFLGVTFQGILGSNKSISIIHSLYLFFSLITFIILILETLRLMDIKNVIADFEQQIIYTLEKRWRKIANEAKDLQKQLVLMATIKNTLVYETKAMIEPIFVTTKRYITKDHYDIVLKGLDSIVRIAFKYIDLFKFSIQDNDQLLTYLIERFQDLKGAITDTSHYSILPNLVSATRQLTLKSLEIETPLTKYHQSYLPLGLINSLKDYVVSKDIYKDTTSSPLDAVNALTDIAIAATEKKNLHIAHSALEVLSEISTTCTKLNFFYANRVAMESNQAIMKVHYHMLLKLNDYGQLSYLIKDTISNPIKAYIEVGEDSARKENLSPFFGTGIDPIAIADPYSLRQLHTLSYIIFLLLDNNDKENLEDVILDYLEEIFSEINQLLMKAGKKKMYFLTREISDTAYGIAFTLLQFLEMGKLKNKCTIKKLIDERLYYIFSNAFFYEFAVDDNRWLNEKLDKWFSIVGLYLISFQTWEGFPTQTIDKVIDDVTKAIPKLVDTFKGKEYINHSVAHDVEYVMSYLNLCIYWQQKLIEDESLETRLVRFIVMNQESLSRWENGKRFPSTISSMIVDHWSLDQPLVAYYSQYLWDSRDYLEPKENDPYYFDKFMKEHEVRWHLIQALKFKIGKITRYTMYNSRTSSMFF